MVGCRLAEQAGARFVRPLDTLLGLAAGATRFGATATAAILDDLAARHRGEPAPVVSPVCCGAVRAKP